MTATGPLPETSTSGMSRTAVATAIDLMSHLMMKRTFALPRTGRLCG